MPSGITSVTRRLSPRRTVSSASMRVWAATALALIAPRSRAALAGEAEEHVLEAAAAGAQLADQRALFAEPTGELGDELGRRRRLHQVVAGAQLAHGAARDTEAVGEVGNGKTGDGRERGLVRRRARRELVGRIARHQSSVVHDPD